MHCPENIGGNTYVELVAAVSIVLAQGLDAKSTFLIAEFMQSVSSQLLMLAAFKDAEEIRTRDRLKKEEELAKKFIADAAKTKSDKNPSSKTIQENSSPSDTKRQT